MADDRTEQPTHRRLRDARRKGQLARSKDVNDAVQLAFAVIGLTWLGPRLAMGVADALRAGITRVGDNPLRTVEAGELVALAASNATTIGLLVGPLALCTITAAVFASPCHPYTQALLSAVPAPDPLVPPARVVLDPSSFDPRAALRQVAPNHAAAI